MTISLVECIIHSRNYFSQKESNRKRLGANTILLENPNPDFNMKIFLDPTPWYTQGQEKT